MWDHLTLSKELKKNPLKTLSVTRVWIFSFKSLSLSERLDLLHHHSVHRSSAGQCADPRLHSDAQHQPHHQVHGLYYSPGTALQQWWVSIQSRWNRSQFSAKTTICVSPSTRIMRFQKNMSYSSLMALLWWLFLGMHITKNLTWTNNYTSLSKKGQHRTHSLPILTTSTEHPDQ